MNEHGTEMQGTEFKLSTPSESELPKSPIEYIEQELAELRNEVERLKVIIMPLHNAGK